MKGYIYGGKLAAKRPVPSRGPDFWKLKLKPEWPGALVEGEGGLQYPVVASLMGFGHQVRPAMGIRGMSRSGENTSFSHLVFDGTHDGYPGKDQMNSENQPPRHTSLTSSRTITSSDGDVSVSQRFQGLKLKAEAKEFLPGAGMHRL